MHPALATRAPRQPVHLLLFTIFIFRRRRYGRTCVRCSTGSGGGGDPHPATARPAGIPGCAAWHRGMTGMIWKFAHWEDQRVFVSNPNLFFVLIQNISSPAFFPPQIHAHLLHTNASLFACECECVLVSASTALTAGSQCV